MISVRKVTESDLQVLYEFQQGIEEIRLEVYAGNSVARQAYEKAGFKDLLVEMRFGSGKP
jgi:ribosomal protein S18 acetylase RimI-like enzyme